ncbi:MAG: cupin domain-containing protein [Candidatus Andersenbacteria bacterium]
MNTIKTTEPIAKQIDITSFIATITAHDPLEGYARDIPNGIEIQNFKQVKTVIKPWGFELWLSDGTGAPYAFKLLYIKKGTKTSLQYHNEKIEHNCLLAGEMRFHYENSKTKKIASVRLTAGHVITVKPPEVHRVEALTDIILMEASTAQLDDVIRLSDDYDRPDGRITAEHE